MRGVIAVFCIPGVGHFQAIRPLVAGLADSGFEVHVFTHRDFEEQVTSAGAIFVDLFGLFPVETADNESMPIPCRYVTYAAVYADDLIREVGHLRPVLIVYETFSVVARVVGLALGIPFVNVTPGHTLDPATILAGLREDPRVVLSDRCHWAVNVLRDRYGVADASPFSYISGLSPYLNVSVEPPSFVDASARKAFEPIAHYGCLSGGQDWEPTPRHASVHFAGAAQDLRIYVCFGTVSMPYYGAAARGVFRAVADAIGSVSGMQVLVSLGGAVLEDRDRRGLEQPNLKIVDFVDQWAVLGEADVFLTHHGVNSTHEAVARQVSMVSYPFFGDQPAMALKCQELGIALPLSATLRGPVVADDVRVALNRVLSERDTLRVNLRRARDLELEVIAKRASVLERIDALVSARRRAADSR